MIELAPIEPSSVEVKAGEVVVDKEKIVLLKNAAESQRAQSFLNRITLQRHVHSQC